MRTAKFWRPALLGVALSAIGGIPMHESSVQVPWAIPAANADDALNPPPAGASGGTTVSASAHSSASVTTSASGTGCVTETTVEATAQAGDQQKSSSDHKRTANANGPCQVKASSRAEAVTGPQTHTTTDTTIKE